MSEFKSRIRKVEQRIGRQPEPGEVDWDALFAHVAKHGKSLVDTGRTD